MRILGLDLGTRTLGISVSDATGLIATPVKTIRFEEGNYESSLKELEELIKYYDVKELVLGLPKNMNGSMGFASERSLNYKTLLESKFNLKVHLVDERLTTVQAEKILLNQDKSRKKRKKVIDNIASSIILETYLKEMRNKNGTSN